LKLLFAFAFLNPLLGLACLPSEIHVREQWINTYIKKDSTKVSSHLRSEHCREVKGHRYFQDSSNEEIIGLKTEFKAWKENEKNILNKEIENLPEWLKKYRLSKIIRATEEKGNPHNPGMTIPATKTLIIFDKFFSLSNKREVILHEMAHIAAWDIDPIILRSFFLARGWKYGNLGEISPPKKLLTTDSKFSPSEDFANSVELYYSNKSRLKDFNLKSFQLLDEIIKSKENKK
jgi:hypothetical protein